MAQHLKPSYIGHRHRLKQRLSAVGLDALLDHEILELLLTYAIPRKDTKPLAWALIKRFGSLANVLDAEEAALLDVPGIGPNAAQFIKLIRGLLKKYMLTEVKKQIQISTPQQVLDYCKASLAGKKEEFLEVIFLSVRNTLISTQVVAEGSISQVAVSPRKIVEYAIKEKASALILVHNHPSGDAHPSPQDIELTQKIAQAVQVLGIMLHDHIIVSKGTSYSLKAAGYI